MPAGVPNLEHPSSTADDPGLAQPDPLPSVQLLRTDGSARRPTRAQAVQHLHRDAHRILVADDAGDGPWTTPAFMLGVAAARRQLEPVTDPLVLAESFAREAFHQGGHDEFPGLVARPARVAYAIRWTELVGGLSLPPWELWFLPCRQAS